VSAEAAQPLARGRHLGPLLAIAGLVGLVAALALSIEKFRQLENPLYVPSCTLSEVLSCGSVLGSDQSELLGFPNSFVGIGGFAAVLLLGLVLTTGGTVGRRAWWVVLGGLALAVVFVHWLAFQTLYRIGALCPYCLVVWAATIPAFWYVLLHVVQARRLDVLRRNHAVGLSLWLMAIALLVLERFYAPWDSVLAAVAS
jgi:uncharacterized membrane protein